MHGRSLVWLGHQPSTLTTQVEPPGRTKILVQDLSRHYFCWAHSFSSHALNFSQFWHSKGFFGSSSPALSQLKHGEATLSHTLGVTGNWGPFMSIASYILKIKAIL